MPTPFDRVWLYQVPDSLTEAGERGLSRAESGDWSSGPLAVRVDDLLGWLAVHAWVEARLVGTTVVNESRGALEIDPTLPLNSASTGRGRIAQTLRRTVRMLAVNADPRYCGRPMPRAIAHGDEADSDTGALPALAVAAIAVAGAAAIAYVAHQAAQVVDNVLARKERLREVIEADAQALRVIERHVAREQEAGKMLPLDAASERVLEELESRQRQLAEKRTDPVSPGVSAPETGFSWTTFFMGAAAAFAAALGVASLGD